MMKVLYVILGCFGGQISLGLPDGAPPKSCKYMLPGHLKGFGSERHSELISHQPKESSRYIINATWDEKHRYVHVSITGHILRGFLIQARQTQDGQAVGSFRMLSNDSKYQDCTGPNFKVCFRFIIVFTLVHLTITGFNFFLLIIIICEF